MVEMIFRVFIGVLDFTIWFRVRNLKSVAGLMVAPLVTYRSLF